jgi:carbamate kinase
VVCEGTLDTCGAETQGLLGYLIQQGLHNELSKANLKQNVVSVITQVLVDKADQAFANPTKPIGPFYTQEEAQRIARQCGKRIVEDSGRGYRLVVPSPKPIDIIEKSTISALLESGAVVIAAGGGGIPVICEDNRLTGVEAVVDKDLASGVLADLIRADYMLLLTGVEQVSINFKQSNEQKLDLLSIAQAEQYLREGQFPEGSMAPKIRAAVEFVKQGGKKTIITTLPNICLALQGKTGTSVVV